MANFTNGKGHTKIFSLVVREAMEALQRKQEQERKEFMKPVITPSGEDYLEAILVLQKKLDMVRSVDVSHQLEVSKASVSYAVTTLREGGFLTMEDDFSLHLTDVGREVAERVYEKHRFFFEMLTAAGVEHHTAQREACRMEHTLSEESFQKLKQSVERKDAHADP